MARRTTRPELTPEQQPESDPRGAPPGRRAYLRESADPLATKGDATEFTVRDLVLQVVAKALEAAPAGLTRVAVEIVLVRGQRPAGGSSLASMLAAPEASATGRPPEPD